MCYRRRICQREKDWNPVTNLPPHPKAGSDLGEAFQWSCRVANTAPKRQLKSIHTGSAVRCKKILLNVRNGKTIM